jgi:CheY-like chemotaxis protein
MDNACSFIVIDDNPVNVMISEFIIRKVYDQAHIISFGIAPPALQYIEEEYSKPGSDKNTILFLDLHMPDMDGFEFLEIFMQLSPFIQKQIKIIVLSATADERELNKARAYTCVKDTREKPFTIKVLKQIIEENGCNM